MLLLEFTFLLTCSISVVFAMALLVLVDVRILVFQCVFFRLVGGGGEGLGFRV